MRKSLLVLLSVLLPFSLVAAACGSDDDTNNGDDTEVTNTESGDSESGDEETTDEEMTDEEMIDDGGATIPPEVEEGVDEILDEVDAAIDGGE